MTKSEGKMILISFIGHNVNIADKQNYLNEKIHKLLNDNLQQQIYVKEDKINCRTKFSFFYSINIM